jgi:phage-related protein
MKPDITFDGTSMNELGWLRETTSFPTPQSQTNTIVVPGRNSPIRYTEALGRVSYQPRTFQITLSMLGSRSLFNQMVSDTVNRFAGQLVKVITSEEPDLYCLGTLQIEPSYDPLTGKGQLTVSCEDGDSYRYHTEETIVTVTGGGTAVLTNDYMPVQPTVKTTTETALTWQVGTDKFLKSVSSGTWTFPELELGYGDNKISITTSGSVTFCYREGRL